MEREEQMAKKIGLALGSGAAKGFAHIGVLQVLEENKIPIDYITGTSIGAVIGGIYACGTDLDMLARVGTQLDEKDYQDIVFPRNGFLRGDKFQTLIQLFTKRKTFDQLEIPFKCIATNLLNGEKVVLDQGMVDAAIRASMAVPMLFEPVSWNEDMLLVDGATVERVPMQTVRDMGADIVIGVDVGYRGEYRGDHLPGNAVGFALMAADIQGWALSKLQEKEADVLIVPKVIDISPTSFEDLEQAIALGREAAEAVLPDIQKAIKSRKKKIDAP